MGLDMATYNELIAHRFDIEQIRERIGADSLAYLSVDGLETAVNDTPVPAPHCNACFSGQYPIKIPEWLFEESREKLIFEKSLG